MPDLTGEIAERIRETLAGSGLSQRAFHQRVAESVGPEARGVSFGAIRHYLSGKLYSPRPEVLRAMADILGVRFEWLAIGRGGKRDGAIECPNCGHVNVLPYEPAHNLAEDDLRRLVASAAILPGYGPGRKAKSLGSRVRRFLENHKLSLTDACGMTDEELLEKENAGTVVLLVIRTADILEKVKHA